MKIRTGCDIVKLTKFQKTVDSGGVAFLKMIFTSHELSFNSSSQSLAGLYAAKEAVKKALDMKADDWLKIEIRKSSSGRPSVYVDGAEGDISISHDGDYAIASASFILDA